MKPVRVHIVRRKLKDDSTSFYLRWYGGGDTKRGRYYCKFIQNEPMHLYSEAEKRGAEHRARMARTRKEVELRIPAKDATICTRKGKAGWLFGRWLERSRSKSTAGRVYRRIVHFNTWMDLWLRCPPLNVSGITRGHIITYRKVLAETLAPSTVNLALSDLSSWLKWCVGEDMAVRNEVEKVNRMVVPPDERPRALAVQSAERFWEILGKLGEGRWEIPALLGVCGLRIGELRLTGLDLLDEDAGTLTVLDPAGGSSTKRHARAIPLPGVLMMLARAGVERAASGKSMNVRGWLTPLGIRPHDLRRFFRTALESTLAPQYVIDDLLGHCTTRVRAAYTPGSNAESARPVMEKFADWLVAGMKKGVILP